LSSGFFSSSGITHSFCYTPARLKPRPLPLAGEPEIPLYEGGLDHYARELLRGYLVGEITGGLSYPYENGHARVRGHLFAVASVIAYIPRKR